MAPLWCHGTAGCHVPAGWFQAGGDPEAVDAPTARRWWVESFVIQQAPVSVTGYATFLDDLGAEAQDHVPRTMGADPVPLLRPDAAGHWLPAVDAEGNPQQGDWPVNRVDLHSARLYARWYAEKTGQPWRLPQAGEWEKAARGVDGRPFPWGKHFDATFCCVISSHSGTLRRHRTAEFPLDIGPYGVLGMAGGSADWCDHPWEREEPPDGIRLPHRSETGNFQVAKGGWWGGPERGARLAGKMGARPDVRYDGVGIRLVRSVP